MGAMFTAVIQTIAAWGTKLFDLIRRPMIWFYGVILTAFLTPVNFIFSILETFCTAMEAAIARLNGLVDSIHIADLPGYWASTAQFVAKADAWVPAILAVTCGIALVTLWVACALIRLCLKIKAIFWAG